MTRGRRQTGPAAARPATPLVILLATLLATLLALAAWALPAQTAPDDPLAPPDLAALTALVAGADLSRLGDAEGPAPAVGPAGPVAVATPPVLVVNEVLADPATDWNGDGTLDPKGDEWIEVRNLGPAPLDLGDYWLRDSSGEVPDLHLSGTADPGEQVVFYGSDAVNWQAANGLSTTGFALNNTGDTVNLLRTVPGTDPVQYELVFAVTIRDHEAEDDRTGGYNLDHTAWLLFDALNPYPGTLEPVGTGCAPSPGAENLCAGQVATETATFGAVKATYR